jgi:hypothetical protein
MIYCRSLGCFIISCNIQNKYGTSYCYWPDIFSTEMIRDLKTLIFNTSCISASKLKIVNYFFFVLESCKIVSIDQLTH